MPACHIYGNRPTEVSGTIFINKMSCIWPMIRKTKLSYNILSKSYTKRTLQVNKPTYLQKFRGKTTYSILNFAGLHMMQSHGLLRLSPLPLLGLYISAEFVPVSLTYQVILMHHPNSAFNQISFYICGIILSKFSLRDTEKFGMGTFLSEGLAYSYFLITIKFIFPLINEWFSSVISIALC